ncbi:hypothetical protein EVC30_132 [Rhizobium phage RHph_Y1_11]|nr:hypothetical protein EVC30_132 [Rhizobium phage RHph_Y1_11]
MSNLFSKMTLEEAKANEYWDAIDVTKQEDGGLRVEFKLAGVLEVDAATLSKEPDKPKKVALLMRRRAALDFDEIEIVARHKVERAL